MTEEFLQQALKDAFSLGQKHWQQANSESYAQNVRAAKTRDEFNLLLAKTLATFAPPVQPGKFDVKKSVKKLMMWVDASAGEQEAEQAIHMELQAAIAQPAQSERKLECIHAWSDESFPHWRSICSRCGELAQGSCQ